MKKNRTQRRPIISKMTMEKGIGEEKKKDRTLWRNVVVALCPTGDEEDK